VVAGSASAAVEGTSDIGAARKSAAEAPPQDELQWIISARDKAVADELVAHFSAQGYTCDMVQQAPQLWAIQVRRPAGPKDDVDDQRREAEAYAQAKGAEFNGGGIAPVGAVRLHNSGQSFPPPRDANAPIAALTPAQLIFAGEVVA